MRAWVYGLLRIPLNNFVVVGHILREDCEYRGHRAEFERIMADLEQVIDVEMSF